MYYLILLLLFVQNVTFACDTAEPYPGKTFVQVLMHTSKGDIVLELDKNRAPITVNNFLNYVKDKHYDKTIFHRVEDNFVVQGGGYDAQMVEVPDCGKIFNESGNGLKNTKGTIAMARYTDPHSATSQFYFNLTDSSHLDPNPKNWGYAVFGEVIEGMDVLIAIAASPTGFSDKLQAEHVPLEPITLISVQIK